MQDSNCKSQVQCPANRATASPCSLLINDEWVYQRKLKFSAHQISYGNLVMGEWQHGFPPRDWRTGRRRITTAIALWQPALAALDRLQVTQLWLTDRATAYVRKVHCAVVSTASGSLQGHSVQDDRLLASKELRHARITRPKRHLPNACEVTRYDQFRTGADHFRRIFDRKGDIAHQPMLVSEN